MMTLPGLRVVARVVHYPLLILAVYMLLKGHNQPGGGFIGGLIASVALVLQALAFGPRRARRLVPVDGARLIGSGLLVAGASGLIGVARGRSFLTHSFGHVHLPLLGEVEWATAALFDVGVFIVVVGVVRWVVLTMGSDEAAAGLEAGEAAAAPAEAPAAGRGATGGDR